MLSLDEDVMTITHLDFDYEEPCTGANCDKAAEWKFAGSCCGKFTFVCDEHFRKIKVVELAGKLRHVPCDVDGVTIIIAERFKVSA